MGALRAQSLMNLVGLRLAPALTAGVIAYLHSGHVGEALIVLGAMLAALQFIERSPFPLTLMPAARIGLGLVGPVLASLALLVISALAGQPVSASELTAATAGAWVMLGIGAWMKARTERRVMARVAVVGSPGFARDLRDELNMTGVRAYQVIGWFGSEGPHERSDGAPRWLGSLDHVRGAVLVHNVDLIVCAPDRESGPGAGPGAGPWERVAASCLDLPVRMLGANQFYEELLGHIPIGTIDQAWYRYVLHPRFGSTEPVSKRALDLALASVIGLLAAPFLLVAALLIKLGDGGPVLYRQIRLGEHGEPFEILKLRTMRVGAEASGAQWSGAEDDRVTRVGRFLRRSHLDELPQLWNIFRGDMTLVGPRPERPEMVGALERQYSHYTRRHLFKPGIAGWAQLRCGYAGSDLGTGWKLCHDLFYIKHRSVLTDVLIVFETAFETFRDAHRSLRTPSDRFILEERAHG
jgi:exopolysaccharide biosynthesis polyprenyl glycosylphosphotransferase